MNRKHVFEVVRFINMNWNSELAFFSYSFRLSLPSITTQTIRKKNRISIEFSKKIAKFNENCLFVAHHQSSLGLTMMVLFQCIRNGTRSTNPTLNTHRCPWSFNIWPSVPVVAARKCSWFHPHSTCWGKIWEIELVEELVQSNKATTESLPSCQTAVPQQWSASDLVAPKRFFDDQCIHCTCWEMKWHGKMD